MSFMPAWMRTLNDVFGPENIERISVEDLPDFSVPLTEGLRALGIPESSAEAVLEAIPESHVYSLRGLIQSAVARNVPVQFSWLPGYDHEMTICEWADRPGSPCGITVVLRSPHVSDVKRRIPTAK